MKTKVLLILLLFPAYLYPQLRINELMSNNVSAIMDETYNYSMWVELYNAGTISENQNFYYFTDDLNLPKKWKPSSRSIAAKGYSVLWFERDDKLDHANFKLEPEGGELYLMNESSQIVDKVIYPAQYRNISYGRKTDNSAEWVFFENHSAGSTNNNKPSAVNRCDLPVFNLTGGFFTSPQKLSFANPAAGDTLYYTTNGAEPTRAAYRYKAGTEISISSTMCIRAKLFSYGKLSGDVLTETYLINERDFNLPVVSITTDPKNLTDDMIGIYVDGKNGIIGRGSTVPVNFNQDWDRPANYELFDTNYVARLNQELDIGILGGWSRRKPLKSLKISPDKKYGDGRLRYDIFAATKPGMEYKAIQMRNSGQDFESTMMRDAFLQSIVMKKLDLDFLAYEPAVLFINGTYYGIENLRERTNEDYLFSNYGLEEEDFYLLEGGKIQTDTSYIPLSTYISVNDIKQASVLEEVSRMADLDCYMNYTMSEIYFGNNDWPSNNTKMWKKRVDGKWRWILYDTDASFGSNVANMHFNSITYALGENTSKIPATWSTLLFRRLTLNDAFLNKFIDRFCVHLSTTFRHERVNHVMDSLSWKIENEIVYHKARWNNMRPFPKELSIMKTFAICRTDDVMKFIGDRFLKSAGFKTIHLSADIPASPFTLNSEPIDGSDIDLKYFVKRNFNIRANPVSGYRFKEWKVTQTDSVNIVPTGSFWKYYDKNGLPDVAWNQSTFDDALWSSGKAQLGYGGKGESTVIGYGGNPNAKYSAAYFRKTISIANLENKQDFVLDLFVDDAAVVYVNGTEIGRINLPDGEIFYSVLASASIDKSKASFIVPREILKEGQNLIAVEVHQVLANNNDLAFDLQMTCETALSSTIVSGDTYSGTLSKNFGLKAIYEKSSVVNPGDKPSVVINELVAGNTLYSDEFGGYDDYLELFNFGNTEVNIAGYYLSDTPTNRTLCQITTSDAKKTTIPSNGRIILWADSQSGQGCLHLGFKLGKEGETIYLSKKNEFGNIITVDSVTYVPLTDNMSYSRITDGNLKWAVKSPTFNQTNGNTTVTEELTGIQVYPTMVDNNINILNARGTQIAIIDLSGRTILNRVCNCEEETIPAAAWHKGMYIVRIGSKSFKIMKM